MVWKRRPEKSRCHAGKASNHRLQRRAPDVIYTLSELSYWNAERQSRSVKPGAELARNSYFASAI